MRHVAVPSAIAFASIFLAAYLGPQLNHDVPLDVDISSSMDGKHILITGGSSGVGLSAAKNLASRGALVYITGRSGSRVEKAAEGLQGGKGVGLVLDLTSAASVEAFAQTFDGVLAKHTLDVVIFNAGMFYDIGASKGPYTVEFANGSRQDKLVAANHLGHFMLLKLLLPRIEASNSRVVFTSSISHQLGTEAGVLPKDRSTGIAVEGESVSLVKAFLHYGNTKLMNVLTAKKLQRLFDANDQTSASVVVCTPGFVATNIGYDDRSKTWNPMEYIPLARSSENGGMVLAFSTTVDAELARGKMLQPYWIWEGLRDMIGNTVARGCFFNFVQEMLLQKLTPAGTVYAHTTNDIASDERVQDSLWLWSEGAIAENR